MTVPLADKQFSTFELKILTEVTQRQIFWWTSTKMVRSKIVGAARRYSFQEALGVLLVADFIEKGVSFQRLRKVHLARYVATKGFQRLVQENDKLYLVINTKGSLRAFADGCEILKVITNMKSGVFMTDVGAHVDALCGCLGA